MKNYPINRQLNLFSDSVQKATPEINAMGNGELELVSFRDLVPEITDTGYLTHSIYYYPAKFIPHVVRFCINTFTERNNLVIDPFAGSGTVGLECYLCERNSFLLDLNPLLTHIMLIKIYKGVRLLSNRTLYNRLEGLTGSELLFYPEWSNLTYWYPDEMLGVLTKYWGWQKNLPKDIYSLIIEAALVKVSKHFSYAEHKTPKLFRSKSKLAYIATLLPTNWVKKMNEMIYKLSFENLERINQFIEFTTAHENYVTIHGGVDSSQYKFNSDTEFDCLITSPPYLQAQEYMRTAKMDLYWLGYKEEYIKNLSKLEIPYRKPDRIIHTKTLDKVKSALKRNDLIALLDSYFCHTINSLENSMDRLKSGRRACIFIGNPVIDGVNVEIWRIFAEHFTELGYSLKGVYEDRIKKRQLFGSRNNKNPEGMESEYLLVLQKFKS
ncbi:MAG: DNA methyltransferase [Deltaproteobacteria bacterium]